MSKRMSISLDNQADAMLKKMAENMGITQNEVINKAIKVEHFVQEAIAGGATVVVKYKDGQTTQILFR